MFGQFQIDLGFRQLRSRARSSKERIAGIVHPALHVFLERLGDLHPAAREFEIERRGLHLDVELLDLLGEIEPRDQPLRLRDPDVAFGQCHPGRTLAAPLDALIIGGIDLELVETIRPDVLDGAVDGRSGLCISSRARGLQHFHPGCCCGTQRRVGHRLADRLFEGQRIGIGRSR